MMKRNPAAGARAAERRTRAPSAASRVPRRARALLVALGSALGAALAPAPAAAQATVDFTRFWTWEHVRAVPSVDPDQVSWLERNLRPPEARTLFGTIAELSKPEAAQMVARFAWIEGSLLGSRLTRMFADSLVVRPPAGVPGAVHVAFHLARQRAILLAALRATPYLPEFGTRRLEVPPPPAAPAAPGVAVRLAFDFAPAESILAIVGTPDVAYEDVLRRIATPAFDAMLRHRSQPFYQVALSREQLALNLMHAASTGPLERLYMYARPGAFYHFGDVREFAAEYRRAFAELRAREAAVTAYIAGAIAPWLPEGTTVDRRVALYFGDLADGWAVGAPYHVTAVSFEYYKDDWPRFLNTMVHEAFHAAQNAALVGARVPPRAIRTAGDSALQQAFRYVLGEGTANYVAPALARTPESADSMATLGAALLRELAALRAGTYDRARGQEILNRGVSAGGPFYWIGAEMTRAMVAKQGPAAVRRALRGDGVQFVLDYVAATGGNGRLPASVVAAARALAGR